MRPGREVWALEGNLGPELEVWVTGMTSGNGMVVWTTVDVCIPIKDWTLGSRNGPQGGLLGPGMKVWDPDIGLSPGWRSGPGRRSGH